MKPGSREHHSGRSSQRWQRLAWVLAAVTLVAVVSVSPPASAVPRGQSNGRIAFDSLRTGNGDIYAIDAPITGTPLPDLTPVQLTDNALPEAKPSWSGPRRRFDAPEVPPAIAFQRTGPDGNTDIYRLDAPPPPPGQAPPPPRPTEDAELVTRDLEAATAADTAPAWAPEVLPGTPVPWAIDGSDPGTPDQARFRYPPIAFERSDGGKRDIFIANFDGSEVTNLTRSPDAEDANPDWSPGAVVWGTGEINRGYLAFDSDRGGSREVWVMELRYNANVTPSFEVLATRQVTGRQASEGGSSFNPSWYTFTNPERPPPDPPTFPDTGDLTDSVAFAGPDQDGGNPHIHVADYARYDQQRNETLPFSQTDRITTFTLTSGPQDDTAPAWSPTGDRIAYQSNRDENSGNPDEKFEIYVMDAGGEETDDVNLTRFAGDDRNPDWEAPEFRTDETIPRRPRGRRSRPRARIASVTPPPPSQPSPPGERGPMRPSPRPGPDTPKPLDCTIPGTARNDMLRGTLKRDVICGKGGDDRIVGLGGNDLVRGDAGNDRIKGGGGNDRILGDAGNDRLHGGGGRDEIKGGPGGDRINAKDRQRDRVSGGPGRDRATVDRRGDRVSGVERLRR
jgi:hypothetical protein